MAWTQEAPGAERWSAPADLGRWPADEAGRCLPRLDAVRDADGRIHVLAMRSAVGAGPEHQQRDVMHLAQTAPDGDFGTWANAGNPYGNTPSGANKRRGMGMPVAAVTGSGRVKFFLRNFGGGLSARTTDDSGWGPWEDLHGGMLEGSAAVTLTRGTVELYATSSTGMLRWYQTAPDGPFERDYGTLLARPSGPVTLVEQTDGGLLMFSRQPGTGWVLANRQDGPGGVWNAQPEIVDTDPGYGPLAHAVLPDGDLALVQRTDDGGLSISRQPLDGRPVSRTWTPLGGGPFVHAPSVAVDAEGRLVVAVLDDEARLRTLTLDASAAEFKAPDDEAWHVV